MGNALQPITATGLSHWASYLINGDDSALSILDKIRADEFALYMGGGIVDCGGESFFGSPEYPKDCPKGDCVTYTALIEGDSCSRPDIPPRPAIAREFPEWPAGEIPPCPAGFVDSSWHNDACPSYRDDSRGLLLYYDMIMVADRECPEFPRFILCGLPLCDSAGEELYTGESWQGVIDAIAAFDKGRAPC